MKVRFLLGLLHFRILKYNLSLYLQRFLPRRSNTALTCIIAGFLMLVAGWYPFIAFIVSVFKQNAQFKSLLFCLILWIIGGMIFNYGISWYLGGREEKDTNPVII